MSSIASFTDTLLTPIYNVLASTTTYILTDASTVDLQTIDKTSGVEVAEGTLEVQTVRPAAIIRMKELTDAGLVPEDLLDAVLSLNGVSWEVKSYYPKPSPNGEADGELYVLLQEAP